MSFAGLPAGFTVAEKSKPAPAQYHGLPEGFSVQKDAGPTWTDALLAAPGGAINEIGGAMSGAGKFIASLPDDPLGYKIGRAIKAAPGAAMDAAGGMMQYMRNLSPEDMRGSAPTLPGGEAEKHPFMALGAGDTAPMKKDVAEHPLRLIGDALMAAGATGPGRALLGKGADLAMAGPRRLKNALADMAPTNRAQNALLEASGRTSSPNAIAALLEGNQTPVPGVPLSAAQITQDPGMAQLEKASRIKSTQAPAWAQFDTGQNSALFNELNKVVDPATDNAVMAARDAREAATKSRRELALSHAEFDWPNTASAIRDGHVTPQLEGDRGGLPAVQRLGAYLNKPETLASPGRAWEARKLMSDALNKYAGADMGEVEAAAKSANITSKSVISGIDEKLDKASAGLWKNYLAAFQTTSPEVNSVQALNNIRADLARKIEGGAVDGNGNPKLSRAYLKQVIERHSTNDFGPTILPGPQGKLDDILHTAQQIEAPQANYRLSTTGGGGSDSIANAGLALASHALPGVGRIGRIASAVSGIGADRGAAMLAELLQNPRAAGGALRTAAGRQAARAALRSSGVTPAMLAAALNAQPQQ